MATTRFCITTIVLATAAVTGAAELEKTGAFYYYGDMRISLARVPDQLSIGKFGEIKLSSQSTLQIDGTPVEVQATPMVPNIWKLSIDPQPASKLMARLQPGIVSQPLPSQEQPFKALWKTQQIERQQQLIEALINDEIVDWAYPAYRNTKTGTLLWLTPRLIIGVDPVVDPGSIEERLPPELRVVRPLAQTHQYVLELIDPRSHDPLEQAARLKKEHAWIQWAEPDFIQDWRRASTPNDALFPNQWHLQNTGQGGGTSGADARLPGAWDVETGNGSVVIAVIDDGVQTTHPDLPIYTNSGEIPGNGVDDDGNGYIDDVNGWDFFYNDNDPNPDLTAPSHGTAVAGVAAAKGDNSVGVSGACQNCSVLSARVFNATSAAENSAFADAITYAGELADILNNSWGGGSPSTAITTAIQGAVANGRGGLGSPTFVSNGNSASGYILFELSGFTSGTWTITWTYHKDRSVDRGFDTAWLDAVTFPDGTTEDFEGCTSLPSGWTSGGDANWVAVNDGTRAASVRGGRCSIRAGSITHNETSSVSVTRTFATDGSLFYRAWPSCETKLTGGEGPFTSSCWDWIDIKVNDGVTEYGPFLTACATYSNQGKPLQDGVISYPANLSESIAVGAATNFDRRSDYSQWGPEIDFLCHSNGGSLGITTTDITGTNGYSTSDYTSTFGGTSSAAPLCSGIAALAITADPTLTAAEVRQSMRDNTRKIGSVAYSGGWNNQYGYGAVDASSVVSAVTVGGSIIVENQTLPDGDPQSFTFSGDAAGTIGDDQQIVVATGPGTFSSTETLPGGWTLLSIDCDDEDSTGNVGTRTASFNVAADETVTCVFTNCDTSLSSVDLSGVTLSGSETYEACDTLTADTFTIQGTGSAHFRAGNKVVLENGFSALSGSEFIAEIID